MGACRRAGEEAEGLRSEDSVLKFRFLIVDFRLGTGWKFRRETGWSAPERDRWMSGRLDLCRSQGRRTALQWRGAASWLRWVVRNLESRHLVSYNRNEGAAGRGSRPTGAVHGVP